MPARIQDFNGFLSWLLPAMLICLRMTAQCVPGTVCRPATGPCDSPAVCAANSTCPPTNFVAAGTVCGLGTGVCDNLHLCTGASATCPASNFVAAGTVCGLGTGVCDNLHLCTGASATCPATNFVAQGTQCGPTNGPCETHACTGNSAICPAASFVAAGTQCGPVSGPCDTHACTGSSPSCPAPALVAAGTQCAPASGVCDQAHLCNGNTASCPDATNFTCGVSYAANLNAGDSFVDLSNSGAANGANLCINLYTFDPAEELVSCCSCTVTPNGLQSLSVLKSLVGNTLTPAMPTSVTIKAVASVNTSCNASTVTQAQVSAASGLLAWSTTLHMNTSLASTNYALTESPFRRVILSEADFTHITSTCGFIQSNGSGFGICKGCAAGGLGAQSVQ